MRSGIRRRRAATERHHDEADRTSPKSGRLGGAARVKCPDQVPSRQGEPLNLVRSSDHAHTTAVLRRSVSDRLDSLRADPVLRCACRRVCGCLNPPALGTPRTNHQPSLPPDE